MTIGIVGIGLIGGSLGLALKQQGHSVLGYDISTSHEKAAIGMGLVDEVCSLIEMAGKADAIAIAVPVNHVARVVGDVLDLGGNSTLFEMSSTKSEIANALKGHRHRPRVVLSHPMAGTEYSGPQSAEKDLFRGKTVVLCDEDDSNPASYQLVKKLFLEIGMVPTTLASLPHDLHVAYVSHISHISSFALSLTVLEKEKDERQIFNLASGGFSSTVRLAKSSANTWSPIFEQNRDNVLDVLEEYISVLEKFRALLTDCNFVELSALIERANAIGPMLPKTKNT